MEQLLANINSRLNEYRSCKKLIEENKMQTNSMSRKVKMETELFQKKFLAITKQIQAYSDLLYAIMKKAAIEVIFEDVESSYSSILSGRNDDSSSENINHVLFAIIAKGKYEHLHIRSGNFLAFCGDPETNHIHVYAYTETIKAENHRDLYERRKRFKEHALHLADDHIDKFDFEEMIPYLERYINNELESIISKSESAIPKSSD